MVPTIIQGLGKPANSHAQTQITDTNLDLLRLQHLPSGTRLCLPQSIDGLVATDWIHGELCPIADLIPLRRGQAVSWVGL